MCFMFFICCKKNFVNRKISRQLHCQVYTSSIFGKLGCDSLYCTINQSRRESLLLGGDHEFAVGKLITTKLKKEFTCGQRDKILGQKKGPSSLSILAAYLPGQPYIASVFLRRFQPYFNTSG